METSHSPVLIQHLQETIHSHHFPPGHTPYSLHKNSALLSTISTKNGNNIINNKQFEQFISTNDTNLTYFTGRFIKIISSGCGAMPARQASLGHYMGQ